MSKMSVPRLDVTLRTIKREFGEHKLKETLDELEKDSPERKGEVDILRERFLTKTGKDRWVRK